MPALVRIEIPEDGTDASASAPANMQISRGWFNGGKISQIGQISLQWGLDGRLYHVGNLTILYGWFGRVTRVTGKDDRVEVFIRAGSPSPAPEYREERRTKR